MQLVVPDSEKLARVEIAFEQPMDDEEFFAFCAENRKLRIEREPTGEIEADRWMVYVYRPGKDAEQTGGYRSRRWRRTGRGIST